MVVTRRQSVAPPPPSTSRANSSQGVGTSRIASGFYLKDAPLQTASSTVGPMHTGDIKLKDQEQVKNNLLLETPPSSKGSPPKPKLKPKNQKGLRTKKNRHEIPNKGISIFDILARLFLLWFTIYTVSVCPDDVQMESPICRTLTEYRRLVLEPYILPPIQAALQHPTITSTVHRVQPMCSTAVKFTAPVVHHITRELRTRVQPRLVWLRIRARPYVKQLQRKYDATLGLYINNLLFRYRLHVQPSIDTVVSNADKQWRTIRPYVRPVWKGVERLPGVTLRILIGLIVNAKIRWVDPQVAKIWAAIMEQERATRVGLEGISVVASVDVAEVIEVITSVGVAPAPTLIVSEESEVPAHSGAVPLPIPPTFDVTAEIVASIVEETFSPFLLSASVNLGLLTEDSDLDLSSPAFLIVPEKAASSAASIAKSLSLPSEQTSTSLADTPVGAATEYESDDDLEYLDTILGEFLEDISADVEQESSSTPEPSAHDESLEEREERLLHKQIETARQRADLEMRHTKWEQKLNELGRMQRKTVKETLMRLREVAVDDALDSTGLIRNQVKDIVNEAEKSLKGLRAFSKKLLAQSEKEKGERMHRWNEVVAKVEKKFGSRLHNSSQIVEKWIGERLQTEMRELEASAVKLIRLANQGQEDLGMGYTWLADVTYHDWQRYHKLFETAESFANDYRSLQDGSAADAPPNLMNDVMKSLQQEVDDIVLGFQASIDQIKSTTLDKLMLVKDKVDANSENITIETTLSLGPLPTETDRSDLECDLEMSILPVNVKEDGIICKGNHDISLGQSKSREQLPMLL